MGKRYGFDVVRTEPPDKPHVCPKPAIWDRHKLGIKRGGRIRCRKCRQLWEWQDTGWTDTWMEWVKIDSDGNRVY